MKNLEKALTWIAWISGVIGALFVLLGFIQVAFTGRFSAETEIVNYFHAADSFFLLTIALFIFIYRCKCKKE
jgi:succinate dehydrogenase/fumarate reductase cytochrome b subunit